MESGVHLSARIVGEKGGAFSVMRMRLFRDLASATVGQQRAKASQWVNLRGECTIRL
jgi:hypothetical protein